MKLKLFFISLCLIFCSAKLFSQTPGWQWARTSSVHNESFGSSNCLDRWGNTFVTGWYRDSSIQFGNIVLSNNHPNYWKLYLVKYDESGNVIWAVQLADGQNTSEQATSVATDNLGFIFITGTFGDSLNFGSTELVCNSQNGQHMFLARFKPSGSFMWARQMGGGYDDLPRSVATDGLGNSYVTGSWQGALRDTFGSFIITSPDPTYHSLFIAKYDVNGNALWAKMASGPSGNVKGTSVKGDNAGNCFMTGFSEAAFYVNFISTTLPANNYRGVAFLVKYDASGNLIWASGSSGTADGVAQSAALDSSGNIFVTGSFSNGVYSDSVFSFGSLAVNNSSHANNVSDVFLAKFDPSGTPLWLNSEGGFVHSDLGNSVITDNNGNAYITGYFESSTITFGSFTLNNSAIRSMFLAKYNTAGTVHWAMSVPADSKIEGNSVAVDSAGNCFVSGEFISSTVGFGTNIISGNGSDYQMFIAKTTFIPLGIISSGNENYISIFPNPFSVSTTIRFNSQLKNGVVELYNLCGQEIKSVKNISTDRIEITREDLPDGIYFIRVTDEHKLIATEKIVVAE
jgi:hypothetical protein